MTKQASTKAIRKRARRVRWIVLGAVLAFMTVVLTLRQVAPETGKWVGVDLLCPFGGLETLYSLLTGEGFIKRTAESSLILLVGMVVMAVIYRRSFCGTICPLGTLQGIFGWLGGKLFRRRLQVPRRIDAVARYLKYVVLAVFAIWTWAAAELVLRQYDPWAAYANLTSPEIFTTFLVGFIVLVASLLGSLLYERFFCKYLCPAGALLALLSRFSVFTIRRDAKACTSCGACDKACMMGCAVSTTEAVASSECISCNECVNVCPVPGALQVTAPSRRRASALATTSVVVAVLVAIVGVTTLAGTFVWQEPTLAEAIAQAASGEKEGPGSGQGDGTGAEAAGEESGSEEATTTDSPSAAPAGDGSGASGEGEGAGDGTGEESALAGLIKGTTTMDEIVEATGIAAGEITAEFGVPTSDFGKKLSQIKSQYGFEPEDVRLWVEQELGL
jgi:polyferredoxin